MNELGHCLFILIHILVSIACSAKYKLLTECYDASLLNMTLVTNGVNINKVSGV